MIKKVNINLIKNIKANISNKKVKNIILYKTYEVNIIIMKKVKKLILFL